MTPPPNLEFALNQLSRAVRRSTRTNALLLGGSGIALAIGLSTLISQWTSARLALQIFGVLAVAIIFGTWVLARRSINRSTYSELRVAELAETLFPELGSSTRTAIDLLGKLPEGAAPGNAFSRELAEAHLRQTAEHLERLPLSRTYTSSRGHFRLRSAVALAVSIGISITLLSTLGVGRRRLFAFIANPRGIRTAAAPLTGDISVTYHYPAYSGLGPRLVPGSNGDISAVVGTRATLSSTSTVDIRKATLNFVGDDDDQALEIKLAVEENRELRGDFTILKNGTYSFVVETTNGERLEGPVRHRVTAELDEYPRVRLDAPMADIELKDDREIDIVWGAEDDFGVGEVALVVEIPGNSEPTRVVFAPSNGVHKRREGRNRWSVSELDLQPGIEARFFIEAFDNDSITGPKRATSAVRKLTIFSARERHRALVDEQRQVTELLVDHLALELTNRFRPDLPNLESALAAQKKITSSLRTLDEKLSALVQALREDELSKPEFSEAFLNIQEHINKMQQEREQTVQRVQTQPKRRASRIALETKQKAAIKQVELDIIYLDDLVALQKIDELKQTAEDLLSAQRQLRTKLDEYKSTRDPGLRAELEREILSLRSKMMNMLARMGDIKRQLPGEYRNMEAGRMNEMDSQLDRLEELLQKGDLEDAAAELEQLANMIEDMVNNINDAEQKFGEERYSEMRESMQEFSSGFAELQAEQQALAESADALERDYRKRSIEQAGDNLNDVVNKVRKLVKRASKELANSKEQAPFLFGQLGDQIGRAQQRLKDIDQLLEQKDLAEARQFGELAEKHLMWSERYLRSRVQSTPEARAKKSWESGKKALGTTREVNALLDKLFPDPNDMLSGKERKQMQRMAQRQKQLQKQAGDLQQQMEQLSQDMPLFGQEPKDAMARAIQEMNRASEHMKSGQLPKGAASKRKALDELKALQESMQRASKPGRQGFPLPLAGASPRRQGRGSGQGSKRDPVELPTTDRNRANPNFRQELLEAAKQKAPDQYKDVTRRYYEELIR